MPATAAELGQGKIRDPRMDAWIDHCDRDRTDSTSSDSRDI